MTNESTIHSPFAFSMSEDNGIAVIEAAGPLNSRYSPMLRDAIKKAYTNRIKHVIVNIGDVHYMDSSGLATLVEGVQLADKHGGKFVLAGTLHEKVLHLFEITRLDDLFVNYPSVQEARTQLAQL